MLLEQSEQRGRWANTEEHLMKQREEAGTFLAPRVLSYVAGWAARAWFCVFGSEADS